MLMYASHMNLDIPKIPTKKKKDYVIESHLTKNQDEQFLRQIQ